MEVSDSLFSKHHTRDARQHWITKILVQGFHSARFDPAFETVAHHELIAGAQLFHERSEISKVVTVISVSHDDVLTSRGSDSAQQRAAIAFGLNMDHTRAHLG